jgi:integrase
VALPVLGDAAVALRAWLAASGITSGPIFRPIDRWGRVQATAIHPYSIARVVKSRAELAGLDPAEFAGHSLRSGFITSAAREGTPVKDIATMTTHRSAAGVLDSVEERHPLCNPAARLLTQKS